MKPLYFYILGIGLGCFVKERNLSNWAIVGAAFLVLLLIELLGVALRPNKVNTNDNTY